MSLNSIKNKLVANCSKCDALCCNAMKFETPTYKKKLGVKCQNLNSQTLKCKIYEKREAKGYQFCYDFDCHGAGQAVTKLFRQLGLDWRNDKKTGKVQFDIFIHTYQYLSLNFFPEKNLQFKLNKNISKQIDPFVEKAINMLGLEIEQNLAHWADISRHRIQKKLVADCNQCDALCCNASQFATPKYKKTAGAICKNIDLQTLKCQIYNKRKNLGYDFCQRFDCHGAGQAVTKLFRKLGRTWQNDKTIEKIQYDVFMQTYSYLSDRYFPDKELPIELNGDSKKDVTSFVDKSIDILSNEVDEIL